MRCAEKDEQMQQLEAQVGQLEAQLHEVQLQVGLNRADRYNHVCCHADLYPTFTIICIFAPRLPL